MVGPGMHDERGAPHGGASTDASTEAGTVAVVVAGGAAPDLGALGRLGGPDGPATIVVAADSGADHALAAGLTIDVVVGDLDSIDPSVLAELERRATRIERHPIDKDATDLELAIDVAVRAGATSVIVVAGHGGRVDQSVANAFVLASPRWAGVSMHAVLDSARVSVVHGPGAVTFDGAPGDVVTLLPVHGHATGVRCVGLEYPLHGEDLDAGTTRGVSNVLLDRSATVSIDGGTLLVIRPGPELLDGGDT